MDPDSAWLFSQTLPAPAGAPAPSGRGHVDAQASALGAPRKGAPDPGACAQGPGAEVLRQAQVGSVSSHENARAAPYFVEEFTVG